MPNVTINLIEPGSLYGDRINQLDFRIAKNFTFGSTRSMISADLYNVLNANPVLTYNNSFTPNGPWLQPNSILTGRLDSHQRRFQLLTHEAHEEHEVHEGRGGSLDPPPPDPPSADR